MTVAVKLPTRHPYASGNYRAQSTERELTTCQCEGVLPSELAGSMYVRNGSNPLSSQGSAKDDAADRPYHWFDGDGMLQGVYFSRTTNQLGIQPLFVNKAVLTDVLLALPPSARSPILPSISTLLGSVTQIPAIVTAVGRAFALSALSFASTTKQAVERLSVANTSVLFHDGRALASCESGPLAWVRLPSLETVGWWDLEQEGQIGLRQQGGILGWMKEWTTAHPKRDPRTQELVLFHSTMLPPYLSYSVIPTESSTSADDKRILAAPVPISGPRMMHDFAASHTHTVLLDMPLSLDPLNLARGIPVVAFSPSTPSRFGVLPRHNPAAVRWYTAPSCVIFHTAMAYNTFDTKSGREEVNMVCCRLNSSRLVYAAGNLPTPASQRLLAPGQDDTCQLYYYAFPLEGPTSDKASAVVDLAPSHAFPLSVIPFEFPTTSFEHSMSGARYVYGCSMRNGSFSAALGSAAKIDCLVKVDVHTLVGRGRATASKRGVEDAVDTRTVGRILVEQNERGGSTSGPIQVFALPPHHYAQEASFVPRRSEDSQGEDDGWLLTYVFDERQLDPVTGEPTEDSTSELWIIDARGMTEVVAKVKLPQRVPYGLHGNWFTEAEIQAQRAVPGVRTRPSKDDGANAPTTWTAEVADQLMRWIA